MKLSLNWLRNFIDLPEDADTIGEKITIHTAELEEIIDTADLFSQIFVGKLIATKAHPDSDKLIIGTFDLGDDTKQIIFGDVHPLTVNNCYPIALAGTELPGGVTIEDGKIRGEKSEGMVCHNGELGMKNTELMNFHEEFVGQSLAEASTIFTDQLFDIDNKSLTHRPDLMGHTGFVRELQTIYGLTENFVPTFDAPKIEADKKITVEIQTENCRRFMAVECQKVTVQNSSIETTMMLENLGTRAISNVVDITNLSLLGLGQPMHAFDADKIEGKIIIRMAQAGEKLMALDEAEYELNESDIVIADEKKILSIAGIMGGLESAVTANTKNIVFESASFDSAVVRKTSARLGLRSESSMRFEKTLDPENCVQGMAFALEELLAICPEAKISSQITDEFPQPYATKTIKISLDLINQYAGTNIEPSFVTQTLQSLGFEHTVENKNLTVTVPSWRTTKDVAIAQDLIEEITRMFGYHNIESKLPNLPVNPPNVNLERKFEWKIRDFWSQQNFYEAMLSSFVAPTDADFIEDDSHIKMMNACNAETTALRKTLASNLLRHLEPELRKHNLVEIFELGHTYHGFENETNTLGLIRAQLNQKNSGANFFALQSNVNKFLLDFGFSDTEIQFIPAEKISALAHPHQVADIVVKNTKIGQIYSVHPTKNTIKKSVIAIAEIEINAVRNLCEQLTETFQQISAFPVTQRDISLVMDEKVLMNDLIKVIHQEAKNLISVQLFDEYRDEEKLGKNIKNLAFHLQFQSKNATLESDTVEQDVVTILNALEQKFQAKQRD